MKNKKFYILILILLLSLLYIRNSNSQQLFDQGMEAFKSGNFGSSELLFRKIIESDDSANKDKAWFYLSLSIFHQKKYKSAVFEFNRFLNTCITPDLCNLSVYWTAESYFQLNDYFNSIEEFKRYISKSKDDDYIAKAYERIGRIYFIQKRYDEAITEWSKALSKSVDKQTNNQHRLNIGEAYYLNGEYDSAVDELKPLLNAKLDNKTIATARLIIGRSYQIKNKHKAALKIFSEIDESLLNEKPFNDVQYYRALSHIVNGNFSSAGSYLESFILTGKNSKWFNHAKYELAGIYIKSEEYEKAVKLLEEARTANIDPALKSNILMSLSGIYFEKDIGKAVICLEEAVSLDTQTEKKDALLLLSKAYTNLGRFKEAEDILVKLIDKYSFDKDIDYTQFLLARVYLEQGDFERAIDGFDKIKELNPFSVYINESTFYLASALLKNNQKDRAADLLNKYIKLKKVEKRYDAYVKLFDLYVEKNDNKNAEKIIEIISKTYLDQNNVEEVLFAYGKILKNKGDTYNKYFKIIISKFFKSDIAGKVFLIWGDESFIKKNYQSAENYYNKYLSVKWRKNSGSVFLFRIITLEHLNRFNDIIELLENEENIPPTDDYTSKQLMLWLSRSYYKVNDFRKAYDVLSEWRLIDLAHNDLFMLLKCSLKAEDLVTAKRILVLLQSDTNLYAESLYEIGLYSVKVEKDNNAGKGYFSRIIIECEKSQFIDSALIELSEIYIDEKQFDEAIRKLNEIKNEKFKEFKDRRNALLIISLFGKGSVNDAIALTKKNLKALLKTPYGEIIVKKNLLYYFENNNAKDFKTYSSILNKYPDKKQFIEYITGKFEFNIEKYKSSYYYFYKLSNLESEYRDEALFHLGLISLFHSKDKKLAKSYFNKLIENETEDNQYSLKGKIYLSIIASETGDIELSQKALTDIINSSDNKLIKIQAENLFEYFGYSKPEAIIQE